MGKSKPIRAETETYLMVMQRTYIDGQLVTQGREAVPTRLIDKAKKIKDGWQIDYGKGMITVASPLIR